MIFWLLHSEFSVIFKSVEHGIGNPLKDGFISASLVWVQQLPHQGTLVHGEVSKPKLNRMDCLLFWWMQVWIRNLTSADKTSILLTPTCQSFWLPPTTHTHAHTHKFPLFRNFPWMRDSDITVWYLPNYVWVHLRPFFLPDIFFFCWKLWHFTDTSSYSSS